MLYEFLYEKIKRGGFNKIKINCFDRISLNTYFN